MRLVKMKWMWLTLHTWTCTQSPSEDGALRQQRYLSVISGSFFHVHSNGRSMHGALKLGGPGQTERGSRLGGPEQKLGSRAIAGSAEARSIDRRLEDAALSFYSTCTVL